jgi:hypothetical protein
MFIKEMANITFSCFIEFPHENNNKASPISANEDCFGVMSVRNGDIHLLSPLLM